MQCAASMLQYRLIILLVVLLLLLLLFSLIRMTMMVCGQHASVEVDDDLVGGLIDVVVVDQDQHNDKESRDHEAK